MFPTIKLNIERWKYNSTFELYVSNMGHIRNKSKADIAPKVTANGYCVVYCYGSINCYMFLHRIVMLTWKPTPEAEKLTVDHLDHNKRNNALSNLEWVTFEENQLRAKNDFVSIKQVYDNIPDKKKEEVKPVVSATHTAAVLKKHPNAIQAERKRANKEWKQHVATATHYYVERLPECISKTAINFTVPATAEGKQTILREFARFKFSGYNSVKLLNKFVAIEDAVTKSDEIVYCGMKITFVYPTKKTSTAEIQIAKQNSALMKYAALCGVVFIF